jgi:hypothetical protein
MHAQEEPIVSRVVREPTAMEYVPRVVFLLQVLVKLKRAHHVLVEVSAWKDAPRQKAADFAQLEHFLGRVRAKINAAEDAREILSLTLQEVPHVLLAMSPMANMRFRSPQNVKR